MTTECDIVDCHRIAGCVLEDMSDGEFIDVCVLHYLQLKNDGYRDVD